MVVASVGGGDGEGEARSGRVGSTLAPVAAVAVAMALAWSYRASIAYLTVYWGDSNYSHGWLIAPIAAAIAWARRDGVVGLKSQPRWWGVLPLVLILASRVWLYERNDQWIEAATIPAAVGAAILAVGGWGLFRWSLPAVAYLFLMLPLPPRFDGILQGPLQTLATIGSVALLQASGAAVVSEGNVIVLGTQRLEVAEACRGLSMLLSFVALIAAMVIMVRRPLWERLVLILSTIPIALLCNIIRIAVTAFLYARFDRPLQTVHDWAGLGMMGLALFFVMLELKLMAWLVVEEEASTEVPSLLRASYGPDPGPR